MKYILISVVTFTTILASADFSYRRVSETTKVLNAVEEQADYKSWVSGLASECKLESPSATQVSHAPGNHGTNEQYIVVRKSICPTFGTQLQTSAKAYVVNIWVPHTDAGDSNIESVTKISGVE